MDRLLQGSKYYFISLRYFKIVTTQDCYFDSDNQRFAEGNYFTDVNVARDCFATIREQYGGELEKIENLIERNKGKLISTISHLVDKALGKPVMGKKSEDEEEAPKKSAKVEPQDIVQELVLAYGTYQDTKAELAAKQEEITKAIKAIIRKFTL